MGFDPGGGLAPPPGDAGGSGAIHPRKRLRLTRFRRFILMRVLCLCTEIGKRLRFLHWFLDRLEEAIVGA
jgi:hypothetical protein